MFRLIEVATGLAAVEGPYFAALGIPVVAGSLLQRANPDRPSEEVVVSRELAIRVWGDSTGRAALGQRIRFGDPRWLTVVGVVGDVRAQSLAQPGQPAVYLPITTPWLFPAADAAAEVRRLAAIASPRAMNAVVEVSANPVTITGAVREAIREVDRTIPVSNFISMPRVLAGSLGRTTFSAGLLGVAAILALFLGAVGIYGLVTYTLSLRTKEIGLRVALGARPSRIRNMLVLQGLTLVSSGIVGGLSLTLVVSRALRALLFGTSANDPLTLGFVALVLVGSALIASWIPAYRAMRIDPVAVLTMD